MKDAEDKIVLENMNKVGARILPNFKNDYKVIVIKILCYRQKNKLGQWNITESPEVYLYIHGQLLFNKSASIIQ